MSWLELLEAASYVVTVIGLPFAIAVFLAEQRKERANEEEAIYLRLSDEYANFMRLVLENADLRLSAPPEAVMLTEEQQERKLVLFAILISLFERAYVLVYEEGMNRQQRRLWLTWEDYMREWCGRSDFRGALPRLLQGEDPDFVRTIDAIAAEQRATQPSRL